MINFFCKIILTTAVIILDLIPNTAIAQYQVDIINNTPTNEFLYGVIGDNEAITISLNFESFAGENSETYSVSGYYYYKSNHVLIPLIGIFNDDLTLYVLEDSAKADSLIHFKYNLHYFEKIEALQKLTGYKEKFIFSSNTVTGCYWTDGKKSLPVTMSRTNFNVFKRSEMLSIQDSGKNYRIDLTKLHPTDHGFSIVSFYADSSDFRVLLAFSYAANEFENNNCNVFEEYGYYTIDFYFDRFDMSPTRYLLKSCIEHTEIESQSISEDGQLIYKINIDSNFQRVISVDRRLCRAGIGN